MKLSKSKYCNAIQCKKMLWLLNNKPEEKGEESDDLLLDNGNEVHEVAKNIFKNHINIEFNKDLNKMIHDTNEALKKENVVITEASFLYNDNFCSVDILKKNNNEYVMYEVKGSTRVKDIYLEDLSYQYYILKNLGLNVVDTYIVYINSNYLKKGELDLNKLFIKEKVTIRVKELQSKVEKNIRDINKYMENKIEPNDDIDNKCFKPYMCPFFKYCTKSLPSTNIFDIRIMYKTDKMKLYKKGVYSFEDAFKEDIDPFYKIQINHEINNLEDEINKKELKKFIDTLSYPMYFLDFETFKSPIPKYDNTSPNEQIPFQYSLHYIEKENGELKHKEYLAEAGIDPRRELAESLVRDIPKDVCSLAYNMMFEKGIIKKLAYIFPDLKEHLMNIHDNMKDLMIPFKERYYYNKKMQGSYSIKYVLPALFPDDPKLDYHNLELVQNGMGAMTNFGDLVNHTKEEQLYIRERLLRYCELDTYAMVKVFYKILEVINE